MTFENKFPKSSHDILISIHSVSKKYRTGTTEFTALNGVSLSIAAGERVFIGGPSGSGKSTLLHIMGCLDLPTTGEIHLLGENVTHWNDDKLSEFRSRHLGFVFQSFNLIPVLSVFSNVEYPLLLAKILTRSQRKDRVMQVLHEVGLEPFANHFPNELSGGQGQRVAIARALVTEAPLLIADEPTANLDSENGHIALDLMFRLSEKKGTTVIICTHNEELLRSGGRVVLLKDGVIINDGKYSTNKLALSNQRVA